jgi:hypothetical protein
VDTPKRSKKKGITFQDPDPAGDSTAPASEALSRDNDEDEDDDDDAPMQRFDTRIDEERVRIITPIFRPMIIDPTNTLGKALLGRTGAALARVFSANPQVGRVYVLLFFIGLTLTMLELFDLVPSPLRYTSLLTLVFGLNGIFALNMELLPRILQRFDTLYVFINIVTIVTVLSMASQGRTTVAICMLLCFQLTFVMDGLPSSVRKSMPAFFFVVMSMNVVFTYYIFISEVPSITIGGIQLNPKRFAASASLNVLLLGSRGLIASLRNSSNMCTITGRIYNKEVPLSEALTIKAVQEMLYMDSDGNRVLSRNIQSRGSNVSSSNLSSNIVTAVKTSVRKLTSRFSETLSTRNSDNKLKKMESNERRVAEMKVALIRQRKNIKATFEAMGKAAEVVEAIEEKQMLDAEPGATKVTSLLAVDSRLDSSTPAHRRSSLQAKQLAGDLKVFMKACTDDEEDGGEGREGEGTDRTSSQKASDRKVRTLIALRLSTTLDPTNTLGRALFGMDSFGYRLGQLHQTNIHMWLLLGLFYLIGITLGTVVLFHVVPPDFSYICLLQVPFVLTVLLSFNKYILVELLFTFDVMYAIFNTVALFTSLSNLLPADYVVVFVCSSVTCFFVAFNDACPPKLRLRLAAGGISTQVALLVSLYYLNLFAWRDLEAPQLFGLIPMQVYLLHPASLNTMLIYFRFTFLNYSYFIMRKY